jgi:small subunit ribosomal protein S20
MANTAQAIKRARQSKQRNALRSAQRSQARTSVKNVVKAIVVGDLAKATDAFKLSAKTLDTMADKRVIHKNKAARLKSRLAARLKKVSLEGNAAQAAAQA